MQSKNNETRTERYNLAVADLDSFIETLAGKVENFRIAVSRIHREGDPSQLACEGIEVKLDFLCLARIAADGKLDRKDLNLRYKKLSSKHEQAYQRLERYLEIPQDVPPIQSLIPLEDI